MAPGRGRRVIAGAACAAIAAALLAACGSQGGEPLPADEPAQSGASDVPSGGRAPVTIPPAPRRSGIPLPTDPTLQDR
jgi:hypothetical protein